MHWASEHERAETEGASSGGAAWQWTCKLRTGGAVEAHGQHNAAEHEAGDASSPGSHEDSDEATCVVVCSSMTAGQAAESEPLLRLGRVSVGGGCTSAQPHAEDACTSSNTSRPPKQPHSKAGFCPRDGWGPVCKLVVAAAALLPLIALLLYGGMPHHGGSGSEQQARLLRFHTAHKHDSIHSGQAASAGGRAQNEGGAAGSAGAGAGQSQRPASRAAQILQQLCPGCQPGTDQATLTFKRMHSSTFGLLKVNGTAKTITKMAVYYHNAQHGLQVSDNALTLCLPSTPKRIACLIMHVPAMHELPTSLASPLPALLPTRTHPTSSPPLPTSPT